MVTYDECTYVFKLKLIERPIIVINLLAGFTFTMTMPIDDDDDDDDVEYLPLLASFNEIK